MSRFAHDAMGSTFEIAIAAQEPPYAQQAAAAAFDELDRLERELSRFVPSSDISQINALRVGQRPRVGIATMECLQLAAQVHAQTAGAFDVTIGNLLAIWTGRPGGAPPSAQQLAEALARTGMHLLEIDPAVREVAVKAEGLKLDLGAVGKGYAVDQMVAVLRDWSIDAALVHGGQSSVLAIGSAPGGEEGWAVAIRHPADPRRSLGTVRLFDAALSGSGVLLHGRHIVDPRNGRPVEARLGAWAIAPSAAVSDAVSTAFMVMSDQEVHAYCDQGADAVSGLLAWREPEGHGLRLLLCGTWSWQPAET